MSTPTAFVFTDFDDTLAKGDSILPYLLYCIRRGLAPRRQLLKAAVAFLRWKLQPSTGRAAKETSLSFIAGRTVAGMDEIARDFFREEQISAEPPFFHVFHAADGDRGHPAAPDNPDGCRSDLRDHRQ